MGVHCTAGIFALYTAECLGYKDIYITGIDFYRDSVVYPFELGQNYLAVRETCFNTPKEKSLKGETDTHSIELELKILSMINDLPDVKLYFINDGNYINQFISLAPENDNLSYIPEQKPLDSQKDGIILPSYQDVFYEEKNVFLKNKTNICRNMCSYYCIFD